MKEVKYVIMDSPIEGEFPILFPSFIKHSFIVGSIQEKYPGIKCVSAAFMDKDLNCYGKSVSLKIGSRPIDTLIMKYAFPFKEDENEL
jgi:hypothetical protein